MKIVLVFLVIGCIFGACSFINRKFKLADDHPIEQELEKLIEIELDMPEGSLDLTPEE